MSRGERISNLQNNMSNGEYENGNIFNFEEPNNLDCWVDSYPTDSKSSYFVGVKPIGSYNLEEIQWIRFIGVRYFEGAMSWGGANVSIGSDNELRNIIDSVYKWPDGGLSPDDPLINHSPEELITTMKLYKIKTIQGAIIKIVAYQAIKLDELPSIS